MGRESRPMAVTMFLSKFATQSSITAHNTWRAYIKLIDLGFLTHHKNVEECQTWGGAVKAERGETQSQVAPGPAHKHRVYVNITRQRGHTEAEPGSGWFSMGYPVFWASASEPGSERRGKAWEGSGSHGPCMWYG